jgi:general secretion pathway protein L
MLHLLAVVRSSLEGFLGWWLAELRGLVPARFSRSERRQRQRLVLTLHGAEVALSEGAGAQEQSLGEAALDAPAEIDALRTALRRARHRKRGVTLRLGSDQGLRRTLQVPLAAREDLGQLLRFEMDRLSPVRTDEVQFAYRVVDTDSANRRITVELQMAPRMVVDHALEVAERLDVVPAALELTDAGAGPAGALNLLPRDSGTSAQASRLNRALAVLALLLAVAAVAIPLRHQRSTADELERHVAAARAAAEQSLTLREQLDELRAGVRFLIDRKTQTPLVTEMLAELTRLIPDQAYVVQLTLRGSELQLHGFANTASELIGLLDQSALFHAPQFRSPVTQDPRQEAERFHISVELTGSES